MIQEQRYQLCIPPVFLNGKLRSFQILKETWQSGSCWKNPTLHLISFQSKGRDLKDGEAVVHWMENTREIRTQSEQLGLQLEKLLLGAKFGLLNFHLMVFPLDPFPSVGTGSGFSVHEDWCEDQQRSQRQTKSRQVNKVWVGSGRKGGRGGCVGGGREGRVRVPGSTGRRKADIKNISAVERSFPSPFKS